MKQVSLITTCMGRLDFLKQTIAAMTSQMESQLIVVDYSCPQNTGDWVEKNYPQAIVVREPGHSEYSATKSRNLGARAANTPWLFFVDADVRLSDGVVEALLPRLEKGCTYHAMPWVPNSMGSFLCHKEAFEKTGGYDECIAGWGDEDRDILVRLHMAGYRRMDYPVESISILQHDDALRVSNFKIKDRNRSYAINRTYLTAKHDLMRINGKYILDQEWLADVYSKTANAVDEAARHNRPVELNLSARKLIQPITGWSTDLTLQYLIVPPKD